VHDDDAGQNEAEGSTSAQRAEGAAARSAKRISFAPTPRTSGEGTASGSARKRSSSRRSTVQSAAEVAERLRADEERRATQAPRAAPPKRPRLTQDRLIAEALETEEANRESLRIFLDREEERKARDRKSKPAGIEGPFVRWHSITTGGDEGERTSLVKLIEDEQAGILPSTGVASALQDPVHADRLAARAGANTSAAPTPTLQSPQLGSEPSGSAPRKTPTLAPPGTGSSGTPQTSPPLSRVKQSRTLLSLRGLPPDTTWVDEFSLLLGSHCAWDAVPIVAARNRPLRPRQSTCALTGLPAVYRDPRSGVPFASAEAYSLLTELLEHRFLWTGTTASPNPAPGTAAVEAYRMGCYAAHVDDEGACGVLAAARAELAPPPAPEPEPAAAAAAPELAASASAPLMKGKKAIAPGDEEAIIAAAQALPSGTTRSGGRRSTGGPAAAGTPARK
jgi:vacuolar protein sorting-associated protein 72